MIPPSSDAEGRHPLPSPERFAAGGLIAARLVWMLRALGQPFNLVAMERAGLPTGRLYPGSWSQWSRDPDHPVETAERRVAGADPHPNGK